MSKDKQIATPRAWPMRTAKAMSACVVAAPLAGDHKYEIYFRLPK